jgi:hypothetical protein
MTSDAFINWWNRKGWWTARSLGLDEETVRKIWEEGYTHAVGYGHRDGRSVLDEDLGHLR